MRAQGDYLFFIENEPEQQSVLLTALEEDLNRYNKLLEFGYLTYKNEQISFSFVGLIVLDKFNVCVLPKYFRNIELSDDTLLGEFIKIIKVLRKAGQVETSLPDFQFLNSNSKINLSEIVLADQILRDYLDYGIYRQVVGLPIINGAGEINWTMTVDLIDPIISRGKPIYLDSYSDLQSINEANVITTVHKFAIGKCLKKFGLLLDYQFNFDEQFDEKLSDIGSTEYLTSVLQRELNITYGDRYVAVIKRLLLYIKLAESNSAQKKLDIFGTGYFHTIWEKACGILFNNKIEQYKQYFSLPKWHDLQGNSITKDGLRPDIIVEISKSRSIAILDAKYYNLSYKLNPFNVFGNPGISDIIKQFLYQEMLEKTSAFNVSNFFVFPSYQTDNVDIIGYTTLPLFAKKKIINLKVSEDLAMKAYLNNSSIGVEMVDCLLRNPI